MIYKGQIISLQMAFIGSNSNKCELRRKKALIRHEKDVFVEGVNT